MKKAGEGLSDQHMAEMAASNIPARRFDLNESGLMTSGKDVVRVIEITKLVEQKRGGGVSVPVEAFEGNNLIFVDEGHKGSGGEQLGPVGAVGLSCVQGPADAGQGIGVAEETGRELCQVTLYNRGARINSFTQEMLGVPRASKKASYCFLKGRAAIWPRP